MREMICPWTYKACVHTFPICGADGSNPFQALICKHDPRSAEKKMRSIKTEEAQHEGFNFARCIQNNPG